MRFCNIAPGTGARLISETTGAMAVASVAGTMVVAVAVVVVVVVLMVFEGVAGLSMMFVVVVASIQPEARTVQIAATVFRNDFLVGLGKMAGKMVGNMVVPVVVMVEMPREEVVESSSI